VARRSFAFAIVALGACLGLFGIPSAPSAQQPASPRHIGVLQTGSWSEEMVQAFRQGLMDNGVAEGRAGGSGECVLPDAGKHA
jgi:hypothetical protein